MRKQLRKETTVIIAQVKKGISMCFPTGPFPPALLAMHSMTQNPHLLKFGPSQHMNLFPLSHLGGNHDTNTRTEIHQVHEVQYCDALQ